MDAAHRLALRRMASALSLAMVIGVGAGALLSWIEAAGGWFYVVGIALVGPVVLQGLYRGHGLPRILPERRSRKGSTPAAAVDDGDTAPEAIEPPPQPRGGGSRTGLLTPHEATVLGMLRRGHSTAGIAQQLGIAPVAVRRHVSSLVHKLRVEDRAALLDTTQLPNDRLVEAAVRRALAYGEADIRHALAALDVARGDYDRARAEYQAVLELRRELGDREGESVAQDALERIEQPGSELSSSIRVLVVDDQDLSRTGLRSMLNDQSGIEVVGKASGGRVAVGLVDELKPDVVLMDLRMPDLSGPDATREILMRHPSTRILALTLGSDDVGSDDVAAALEAGACGFLAKDTPIDGVAAAVRAAVQGAAWLSPRAAEVVLGRVRGSRAGTESDPTATQQLSARELEVLRLIARGMENSEIAEALNISRRTAKNHVSNILSKLGLNARLEAEVFAVQKRLGRS